MSDDQEGKKERKKSNWEHIEEHLQADFEFFFNEITQRPEYRRLEDGEGEFRPVNSRFVKTVLRDLAHSGITASEKTIWDVLESDFVRMKNPVKDYFFNLEKYHEGERDHIEELAQTVNCKGGEKENEIFRHQFKQWITGLVANAIKDDTCYNHLCLVLVGEGGINKTTWLHHLIPARLKEYFFNGKVDTKKKDANTHLSENLIVVIDDQLKSLKTEDENGVKELITKPKIQYRRPWDKFFENYPHMATTAATENHVDFLTDVKGSRRFLPFEVESIDFEATKRIDLDRVYAQAKYLWERGFKYYLEGEENEQQERRNLYFKEASQEEELIHEIFRPPEEGEEPDSYLTSSQIKSRIEESYYVYLGIGKLGRALKAAGFVQTQKRVGGGQPQWVWAVRNDVQPRYEAPKKENPLPGTKEEKEGAF
jgi:predicted P-loop ATPase